MRRSLPVVLGMAAVGAACNALTDVGAVEFGDEPTVTTSAASVGAGATTATSGGGTAGAGGAASGGSSATGGSTTSSAASGGAGGFVPCSGSMSDCDGNAANGCETDVATHVSHCGACDRACSSTQVASLVCAGGLCTSSCSAGFANCEKPISPLVDDGCETDATTAQDCGGCGSSCPQDFACEPGSGPAALSWHCGCQSGQACGADDPDSKCQGAGNCTCGSSCAFGETCSSNRQCSCNGGVECSAQTEVCCAAPAGCTNVAMDPQNCGACGHQCSPGFACAVGVCGCTVDAACDAGTTLPFACAQGTCVCDGTSCAIGARCQPSGSCG